MGLFDILLRRWRPRPERRPQPGEILSRGIACDVCREILVVATDRLSEGIITARVRTINVLYVRKGLAPKPEFGPPGEVRIEDMWSWTGQPWGGLPDGTSLAARLLDAEPSTGGHEPER